ncbi:MAG TPA: hypothetical protein VGE74_19740 [Gemmata sp.]
MRLRLAKKIAKTIGTARETAYSERQQELALNRLDRTKSQREAEAFWNEMMAALGPDGRAALVNDLRNCTNRNQPTATVTT